MKYADNRPRPQPRRIEPMEDDPGLSWPATIAIALFLAGIALWAVFTLPMPV